MTVPFCRWAASPAAGLAGLIFAAEQRAGVDVGQGRFEFGLDLGVEVAHPRRLGRLGGNAGRGRRRSRWRGLFRRQSRLGRLAPGGDSLRQR